MPRYLSSWNGTTGRGLGLVVLLLATMSAVSLAGLATPLWSGLALGTVAGIALLLALAALAPSHLCDALYAAFLATASIPVDKYFAYQPHVGGWPGLRFALADILLLLLSVLALLAVLLHRKGARLPAALAVPYLLLLGQYVVSILRADQAELGMFELAGAAHALSVAVVVAALFRRSSVSAAFAVASVMVVLHSSVAFLQIATGRPIGAGIFRPHEEVMREMLVTGSVRLRPSGLFDHPIVFADFIQVSLPLLFAAIMVVKHRLARAGVLVALAIGTSALILTLARGAWIASSVSAAVFVLLAARLRLLGRRQLFRFVGWASAVTLAIALLVGPRIYERFTESQEGNLRVRLELNEIALSMIADRPLDGVGLNNFLPAMARYDPKDVMRYFPGTVHNLYLLEAAETGLPGILLLLACGVGLVVWSSRRLGLIADPARQWLAVAVLAGLAGFSVSQLADFSYRLEPLRTVLWCEVGLLVGALGPADGRGAS